jgi:dolichol-phosphate mannosyltransferase
MILTVIIPTYNEAENLTNLTASLLALPLPGLRLLVVDDASPDGTGQIAERLAIEYPGRVNLLQQTHRFGYGQALISGFKHELELKADAIATLDADFSHPPELLPQMVEALKTYDVALGSRYVAGGQVDKDWPAWRKGLSRFGNFYARSILQLPMRDVTGGFRVYRREVIENLPLELLRSNGYAFLVEVLYVIYKLGFTFQEIPFYFADRRFGQSKMSFRVQREAALRVWQMRFAYRDLRPVSRVAYQ